MEGVGVLVLTQWRLPTEGISRETDARHDGSAHHEEDLHSEQEPGIVDEPLHVSQSFGVSISWRSFATF